MSKFFALNMAREVAKHPSIKQRHYLFGLIHSTVYVPTNSAVESYSNYYNEADARLFKNLIESPSDQLQANVESLTKVECTPGANFRLDLCISHDGQFVAMQLNHVVNEVVTHITPIRYFEGKDAETVDNTF